jgi:hypothetical protein
MRMNKMLGKNMTTNEVNHNDWKEIRARVDSMSNAIFLISGGALTLSVSTILKVKETKGLADNIVFSIELSWYFLLASIIFMVSLKFHLIAQSYIRSNSTASEYNPSTRGFTNKVGWSLGILGFTAFLGGMILIVYSASLLLKV